MEIKNKLRALNKHSTMVSFSTVQPSVNLAFLCTYIPKYKTIIKNLQKQLDEDPLLLAIQSTCNMKKGSFAQ